LLLLLWLWLWLLLLLLLLMLMLLTLLVLPSLEEDPPTEVSLRVTLGIMIATEKEMDLEAGKAELESLSVCWFSMSIKCCRISLASLSNWLLSAEESAESESENWSFSITELSFLLIFSFAKWC